MHGAFADDIAGRTVKLLHIWVAQLKGDDEDGVGLAIDALDRVSTDLSFTVTAGAANNGRFRHGPAIVSAIAVISAEPRDGRRSEVIQWSNSLTVLPCK
jgi:hypothetical protein